MTETETKETYNGWTNYETWAVKLWMDNDQGTQEYWQERAKNALRRAKPSYSGQTKREAAQCDLSRMLKEETENGEMAPDLGASMYAALLNAALSEVNYYEIAGSLLDDVEEDA